MPGPKEIEPRKLTKLSLSKKLQKYERVKGKPKEKRPDVIVETASLDETSEFKDAQSFSNVIVGSSGEGDCRKISRNKTEELNENCSVNNGAEGDTDRSVYECQVCNKVLSHMSIQRRQQHVNRCIDKIEDTERQKKEEERLLKTARNSVLNCPICGKNFKSENARVMHLKKCSRANDVTTDKLIQLVKDQEKERADQLAAGIIPQELRTKISKAVAPKKRKIKEPKNQYEEDVLVAMAMSSSITAEQESTQNTIMKTKGKKKGKEILEDVCLLTTLSDRDRQRRIEEKVSNILQMSNNHQANSLNGLYESELKSSHKNAFSLWDISAHAPDSCCMEQFYVGALVPPLSMCGKVEPGRNFRRLSSIPGREKSFVERNEESVRKDLNTTKDNTDDEIIAVSTQTAVVLAELAVDGMETLGVQDILPKSPTVYSTSQCDVLEASGFCVEMMALDKSLQEELCSDTLFDYRKLVNNKDFSDVVIITASGDKLFAHKLILSIRCPAMLQTMEDSIIKLDYPSDVVVSALKFLYTGELTVAASSQSELKKLAEQFELASLIPYCDKLELCVSTNETEEFENTEGVNEKEVSELNMKEIWGESDSDPDNDDDDVVEMKDKAIDDDDYRDILATQRKTLQNSRRDCEAGDSESELVENKINEGSVMYKRKRNSESDSSGAIDSISGQKTRREIPEKESDTVESGLPVTVDIDKLSDSDKDMPKPKRLKLSDEVENNKPLDVCSTKYNQNESIVLSDSFDEEIADKICCVTNGTNNIDNNIDNSGPNDSYDYANSSAVDLFASPSPQRPNSILARCNQTVAQKEEQSANITTSKVWHKKDEDEVSAENSSDLDGSQLSLIDDQVVDISDEKKDDVEKIECSEDSGDDVEITGDNFSVMVTPSPTFKRSKSNSSQRFQSSEYDKIQYLGLERKKTTDDDKSLKGSGNNEYNLVDTSDDNEEIILVEAEDETEFKDNVNESLKDVNSEGDHVLSGHEGNIANEALSPMDCLDGGKDGDRVKEVIEDSEHCDVMSENPNKDSPEIQNESFQSYQADVWDGFDDCGMGYDPPYVSPEPHPSSAPSCSKDEQDNIIDLSQNEDDNNIGNEQLEDDLDCDFLQDGDDSFVFKVDEKNVEEEKPAVKDSKDKVQSFKTPKVAKKTDKKKPAWSMPSPFTPMPKYNEMATPVLKKELQKYGVKPVGKKRMLKLLTDIYEKTHQYETDSDVDDGDDIDDKVDNDDDDVDDTVEEKTDQVGNVVPGSDYELSCSQGTEDDEFMHSQLDSLHHDVLEESCLHMTSSDSDTSSTSSPQKDVDVNKKLFHYFKSHPEIHMKVLTFEPLELDVLKKNVKESGIKCSMDKLMDFLDERCIAFTTKNSRKNRVQKKRGRKKASTSKQTDST